MTQLTIARTATRYTPAHVVVDLVVTDPTGTVFAVGHATEHIGAFADAPHDYLGWHGTIKDPTIRHWNGDEVTWEEAGVASLDLAVEQFTLWAVREYELGPTNHPFQQHPIHA